MPAAGGLLRKLHPSPVAQLARTEIGATRRGDAVVQVPRVKRFGAWSQELALPVTAVTMQARGRAPSPAGQPAGMCQAQMVGGQSVSLFDVIIGLEDEGKAGDMI